MYNLTLRYRELFIFWVQIWFFFPVSCLILRIRFCVKLTYQYPVGFYRRWWTCCHSQKSALKCINQSNVDRSLIDIFFCFLFSTTTTTTTINDKNKVISHNMQLWMYNCHKWTWCDLGRHPIICYAFILDGYAESSKKTSCILVLTMSLALDMSYSGTETHHDRLDSRADKTRQDIIINTNNLLLNISQMYDLFKIHT